MTAADVSDVVFLLVLVLGFPAGFVKAAWFVDDVAGVRGLAGLTLMASLLSGYLAYSLDALTGPDASFLKWLALSCPAYVTEAIVVARLRRTASRLSLGVFVTAFMSAIGAWAVMAALYELPRVILFFEFLTHSGGPE